MSAVIIWDTYPFSRLSHLDIAILNFVLLTYSGSDSFCNTTEKLLLSNAKAILMAESSWWEKEKQQTNQTKTNKQTKTKTNPKEFLY